MKKRSYTQAFKLISSGKRKPVFFLDYDGTLTPIVSKPELAKISKDMRNTVTKLSKKYTTAIVSGRMRTDVQKLAGVKGIAYSGSHGFDIKAPGLTLVEPRAKKLVPLVSRIIKKFKKQLKHIPGVLIEEKKFSVAVHYRLANAKHLPEITKIVKNMIKDKKSLRLMSGKKVFEILPSVKWDKGKAVKLIMKALKITWKNALVIYIGDDVTDEYAFKAVKKYGLGILVSKSTKPSAASLRLKSPDEVKKLFKKFISNN